MIIVRGFFQGSMQVDNGFPKVSVIIGRLCPKLPEQMRGKQDVSIVWPDFSCRIVFDKRTRVDVQLAQLVDRFNLVVNFEVVMKAANSAKLMPANVFVQIGNLETN